MVKRYPPINARLPKFWHGGDYNPEQWMETPEIWKEDMRLAKLAQCNVMTVGVFSWSVLEPSEGHYNFAWLDQVLDMLVENGMYAVLATPSGARPAWLSERYPEVLRVGANRVRNLHGGRHNHCYTSPIYREKAVAINTKLAKRYGTHPALLLWHVSNEYGGECHCDLCQVTFRDWLKERYHGDLDALNQAWWTRFWSHTYTDWGQVESPAPHGESSLHGLTLDWKRFVSDQTIDFFLHESATLRAITPDIPITTNLMGTYPVINYWRLAPHLDVASWDSYPTWHGQEPDWILGSRVAFLHDLNRSLKGGKPFMLMESTPSMTNWQPVAKLKRPGMHVLSSLQAVAHGSDTVQYFQWRKSRGSSEKFHGAVVDHVGHENTRVFRDVSEVGSILEHLDPVIGTSVPAQVAVIYDWENRWAIEDAHGPRQHGRDYQLTCEAHHRAFWKQGIPVDVIDMNAPLDRYSLVVAPMLYMVRPGVAERFTEFVEAGGTLVITYWSGVVDEHDLCFLGGFPGPLKDLAGIWAEEIDALYEGENNRLVMLPDNGLGLTGEYTCSMLCELIHADQARVLATYGDDFYAGSPAVTVHQTGLGQTYYVATRTDELFLADLYGALARQRGLPRALESALPEGVTAQVRTDGERDFIFVQNFTDGDKTVTLPADGEYHDLISKQRTIETLTLSPFGVQILTTRHRGDDHA